MDAARDHALVVLIRQGDEAAFHELYLRYHQRLLEFAAAILHTTDHAKDILHDVFARLWLKRDTLNITGRVDVYLYKAVRYSAIDIRRRQRRSQWFADGVMATASGVPGHGTAPAFADRQTAEDDAQGVAMRVIANLPPTEQRVVLLRWRYGLSNQEIAEVLEKTPGAVAVYLSRAKDALRRALLTD